MTSRTRIGITAIVSSFALLSCAGGGRSRSTAGGDSIAPTGSCEIGTESEWRPISSEGAPHYGNGDYRAFWTTHGMVVLRYDGGGGVFDPCADRWRSADPLPHAVVTGPVLRSSDALVFAGESTSPVSGWAFHAGQLEWRRLPESPGQLGAFAARAWTGSKLFVWGGVVPRAARSADEYPTMDMGEGAILDVASNAWRPVSKEGAPTARARAVAAWTGKSFVVWGGTSNTSNPASAGALCPHAMRSIEQGCVYHTGGAAYDPAADRWRELPHAGEPPKMLDPAILWTGKVVLLWDQVGGSNGNLLHPFDPELNRWGAPIPMPRAYRGEEAGLSGGRVVYLAPGGGHVLEVDRGRFSAIPVPKELGACDPLKISAFEPKRVIVIAPTHCRVGHITIAALDPIANTWTTKVLPGVPINGPAGAGKPAELFNGPLVWTGKQVIAWGGAYGAIPGPSGCENAPPDRGCDPSGAKGTPSDAGFLLKPAL